MSRLREGRANTARGAAHFLRETVGRVRYGGASGQLTVRADSGFSTHAVVAVCRRMDVRFSITIRQHKSLRNLIEAIPEADWRPIPYWMDGAADVAETTCTPLRTEPDAAPVRLIVRRGEAHARFPTGPLRQLQLSRLHHRPGRGNPGVGGRPPPPCRGRERHSRPEVRRGVESSSVGPLRRHGAWLAMQVMAHNLARWTGADRSGRADRDHQDPPGGGSSPSPDGSPAQRVASHCIFPSAGLGKPSSIVPWPDSAPCHSQPDGARPPLTQRPRQLNVPANSHQSGPRARLAASYPRHLAHHSQCRAHRRPQKRLETAANFQSTRIQAPIIALVTPLPPFRCPRAVYRWIRAKR